MLSANSRASRNAGSLGLATQANGNQVYLQLTREQAAALAAQVHSAKNQEDFTLSLQLNNGQEAGMRPMSYKQSYNKVEKTIRKLNMKN